jgi:hypothetical protein
LVRYVQNQVHQDPRHYHAFIAALKSDLAQYGGILTKLEETRLSLASERQPVIPQHPPREGTYGLPAQGSCLCNRLCSSWPGSAWGIIASSPGLPIYCGGGGGKAWYLLHAHASTFP